jgi:putative transposase
MRSLSNAQHSGGKLRAGTAPIQPLSKPRPVPTNDRPFSPCRGEPMRRNWRLLSNFNLCLTNMGAGFAVIGQQGLHAMQPTSSSGTQGGGPPNSPLISRATVRNGSIQHEHRHNLHVDRGNGVDGHASDENALKDATFYKWRSRFGGMEISDARRLKALEDENRKLKKLLAETMLDASTLKEMLGKKF